MKSVYKIFAVILAAGLTVMSCDKKPINEDIPEVTPDDGGTEQDATTRVITLSFDTKATRTYLDGKTPKFRDGDEIAVALFDTTISDPETDIEKCPVSVDENGIATTTTKFTEGKLMAVYPAEYALVDDGKLTYMVPFRQTGLFKDANICTAIIQDGKNPTAEFENRTAVFTLKVSDDFDDFEYVDVRALDWIDGETGQRSEKAGVSYIQFDDEGYYSKILVLGKDVDGICYISVLAEDVKEDGETVPKVLLRDLNFDVCLGDYRGFMGGFSPKFLTYNELDPETKTVQAGAIYTGVEDHLHEYINFGQVKWATMNVGATSTDRDSPNSYGLYFAWGETTGHKWNTTAGVGKFEPINDGTSYSFTWGNGYLSQTLTDEQLNELCPFVVNPYNTSKSYRTLSLKYDAAYQNWGGAWRMPRQYETLYPAGTTYTVTNYIANSVRGDVDFANVGYGTGTSRTVPTGGTAPSTYWPSTLSSTATIAYYVSVNSTIAIGNNSTYGNRYIGHVIRPVSGVADE